MILHRCQPQSRGQRRLEIPLQREGALEVGRAERERIEVQHSTAVQLWRPLRQLSPRLGEQSGVARFGKLPPHFGGIGAVGIAEAHRPHHP